MAAAAEDAAPMEAEKEAAPMEAADLDWSTCPEGILEKISEKTDILFDLPRFQSVSRRWRSSSIPIPQRYQPWKFPILKLPWLATPDEVDSINNGTNPFFCYISKLNVVLVKQPPQNVVLVKQPPQEKQTLRPWLIGICQTSTGKTHLCHPLSNINWQNPPVLDFSKLSSLHLGCNFIRDDDLVSHPHQIGYMAPLKLAVVKSHGEKNLFLGTFNYSTPRSLLKCGDDDWKLMSKDLPISINLGDMRHFKGRSYAVDGTGRTVIFEPDSSYHLMSESFVGGGGGRVKFLVENDGELLLADVYERKGVRFTDGHDSVKIDFFKLDEYEKKWVKFTSLEDRVVFLGMHGSFSVSASDLCVSKGNCVVFMDNILELIPDLPHMSFVLDLDKGRVTPLSKSPEYSNLFWPPPSWIDNNN